MWDGFHAYKLYVACHIQFNRPEKWDIRDLKFGDKLPLKREKYESRSDKRLFEILAITFSMRELFTYYIANFLYGHKHMVYFVDIGKKNYNKFVGNRERLTYLVNVDLKTIRSKCSEYTSEKLTDSKIVGNIWELDPICIYNMYIAGLINIETLIAIDKVTKIVDTFYEMYPERVGFCKDDFLLIRKANIFLKLSPQIIETLDKFFNKRK